MTLAEIIERIKMEAMEMAGSTAPNPLLETEVLIELILPKVIHACVDACLKDEEKIACLRANYNIAFTAGVANLPTGTSSRYAQHTYFYSFPKASYRANFTDYLDNPSSYIDTFTVQAEVLYFRQANTAYTAYGSTTQVSMITIPQIPATISTAMSIDAVLLEEVIFLTACIITGAVPPAVIGIRNLPSA